MSQTLSQLIAQAQQAYMDAAVTYQGATIDQQVQSKPALDKVATQLSALQTKQLDSAIEVDDADVVKMTALREQVNNAATLQTGLQSLASILLKFV